MKRCLDLGGIRGRGGIVRCRKVRAERWREGRCKGELTVIPIERPPIELLNEPRCPSLISGSYGTIARC